MLGKKKKPGGRTPHLWVKNWRWGFIFGETILIFALANLYLLAKAQAPQESLKLATASANLITQEIRAEDFPFPVQWPITGEISQNFSKRHAGLDIQATYGAKIHPLGPGVVIEIGYRVGYGRVIVVQHKEGFSSMYAHLAKTQVEKNQPVGLQTEIGSIGTSGWTTGAHLHLETYENEKVVDPKNILP
jgi:murein DD-endopeptidase MepM/ murein hydrolase activator NlpD